MRTSALVVRSNFITFFVPHRTCPPQLDACRQCEHDQFAQKPVFNRSALLKRGGELRYVRRSDTGKMESCNLFGENACNLELLSDSDSDSDSHEAENDEDVSAAGGNKRQRISQGDGSSSSSSSSSS